MRVFNHIVLTKHCDLSNSLTDDPAIDDGDAAILKYLTKNVTIFLKLIFDGQVLRKIEETFIRD